MLGREVPDDAADAFAGLVARRAAREPLQHLTGVAAFRHLELAVGPGVFVPRPETEEVAQVAIDEAAKIADRERASAVVVDLCTGSGAIALAVATEVPGARVHAVELDKDAHAWAERNVDALSAALAGTSPAGTEARTGPPSQDQQDQDPPERIVRLVKGDARTALYGIDGMADVVVSNPPYVPSDAVPVDPRSPSTTPPSRCTGWDPTGWRCRAASRTPRRGCCGPAGCTSWSTPRSRPRRRARWSRRPATPTGGRSSASPRPART